MIRLALLLLALAAWPAAAQERASVTIVYFGDVADIESFASSGGLPRIATAIAREKSQRAQVIVASGGNVLSPSPVSAVDQGAHMARVLDQMLVDVMVANVHEFDFGPDVAAQRFSELNFPVLGTNVVDGTRRADALQDGVIVRVGTFRLGFVGAVRSDTADLSSPGRLRFGPFVAGVRAAADQLRRRNADVVVLLCAGTAAECDAASDGVDIVLASNGAGAAAVSTDGRRSTVRIGVRGNVLAAVDIGLAHTPRDIGAEITPAGPLRSAIDATPEGFEDVVTWNANLRLIDTRAEEPDQLIEVISQIELDRASLRLNERLATPRGPLTSRIAVLQREEASLADLVADALRARAAADAAIINASLITGNRDYDAGTPLLIRTLVEELASPGELVVVTMTGAQLRAALEHGLALLPEPAARFPQVAGITVRFDPRRPAGRRIVAIEIGGRPLDPGRRYRVATSGFLARGGEGYAMIAAAPRATLPGAPLLIHDVVIDYVRGMQDLPVPPDGRLRATTR